MFIERHVVDQLRAKRWTDSTFRDLKVSSAKVNLPVQTWLLNVQKAVGVAWSSRRYFHINIDLYSKVKCDEGRPGCQHCQRLHLSCEYTAPQATVTRKSRKQTSARTRSSRTDLDRTARPVEAGLIPSSSSASVSALSFEVPRSHSQGPALASSLPAEGQASHDLTGFVLPESSQSSRITNNGVVNIFEDSTNPVLGQELWDLDLLGVESIWAQLPIFSNGSCGIDSILPTNFSVAAGQSTQQASRPISSPTWPVQSTTDNFRDSGGLWQSLSSQPPHTLFESSQLSPSSNISLSDIAPSEVILLRHFVDFAIPPILIGVEPRWKGARNVLLRIAKSSSLVRHAICSFSALSLSEKENHANNQACKYYYNLAFEELQNAFQKSDSPGVPENRLENEHILASIFFLSYVELTMSSEPRHTLEFLRRAHGISRATKGSVKTPLGNQMRIWLKLLDAKVVSAGGEGMHLSSDSALKDFDGLPAEGEADTSEQDDLNNETSQSLTGASNPEEDVEDILFHTLNHPAYNFYLQVLDFAGRIAHLDKWHRPRGSVADELEVMTAAGKIVEDLDALWARRPQILNLASQVNGRIGIHLSPKIATDVESHLRTYVANYYACFVHLQRAVYPYLASTPKTKEAVGKIVELVRLSASVGQGEELESRLSVSMLWPLMMAGCEVEDSETREWLIGVVEGMSKRIGNASRTAQLIREICKRQERWKQRADARTVMQEIFETIFAII